MKNLHYNSVNLCKAIETDTTDNHGNQIFLDVYMQHCWLYRRNYTSWVRSEKRQVPHLHTFTIGSIIQTFFKEQHGQAVLSTDLRIALQQFEKTGILTILPGQGSKSDFRYYMPTECFMKMATKMNSKRCQPKPWL
ncbi:MAG: hypothetical protein LAT67_04990 [Balneolales bacterium]|nr:hypothetical protein [Balneolales bacterium]